MQKRGHNLKIKKKKGTGDDETWKIKRCPSHVIAFVVSNSRRNMNHSIMLLDRFKTKTIITWIQIRYIESKKHWDKLLKTNYFAEDLGQGKNDNDYVGSFYVLFLASNV